jgi:pilus assembly protein CpaB
MNRQRRRGLVLVSLALASGGLAASEVGSRTAEVEQRVGPMVSVVAARAAIEPGTKLNAGKLTVVQVPARYAPPDALSDPAQADGLRTGGALEAGSYVTASAFGPGPGGGDDDQPGTGLARGERAIELKVAGAEALGGLAGPGARVDVLITTETGEHAGRTALALEDVELLAIKAGDGGAGAAPDAETGGTATATLRVTLKQAVYLTAAQNFARETRLLPRAPGDRRRSGRLEATPAGL